MQPNGEGCTVKCYQLHFHYYRYVIILTGCSSCVDLYHCEPEQCLGSLWISEEGQRDVRVWGQKSYLRESVMGVWGLWWRVTKCIYSHGLSVFFRYFYFTRIFLF